MMRSLVCRLALAAVCVAGMVAPAAAQDEADRLRVFVDCQFFCDMDFLRTELNWVDYMRDRADAQVHILVTRQTTGGGGGAHTLEFIGLRDFAGRRDTLNYTSSSDDTQDIVRRGLIRTIKLGLVPFVANTPLGRQLEIGLPAAAAAAAGPAAGATPQNDPWNSWRFSISMNGFSQGESQQNFQSLYSNISANRTTADWKFTAGINNNYNESTFEYMIGEEARKTVSISRSYGANTLLVKALGPQLSVGGRASASTSTFGNTSLSVTLAPAVEYNFVPYSESTRRSMTLQYSVGGRYFDYREITLFDQEEETRPIHTLALNYTTRQPWGSVNVGLDGSQYLHDTQKYSAGLGGSTSLRLFRGFSFNVGGNYRHVRDQLHLPKRDLTEEEILLRQRALKTDYSYFMNFGISYSFGSIFNNVVNPRMGGSSGGGITIMM